MSNSLNVFWTTGQDTMQDTNMSGHQCEHTLKSLDGAVAACHGYDM